MYKNRQAVLGVAVIAMGMSGLAIAQDDKYSNEATVFEEVIVTATKREQSIYDVPMAVTAFTTDMIEKQGITDLIDIGKFVPNLTVTGFSGGHTLSAR